MTLTLYKFTAGEASPLVVYGKGSIGEAIRYGWKLRKETGHPYKFQKVLGEDIANVERNENVRIIAQDLRIDAEHDSYRTIMNAIDAAYERGDRAFAESLMARWDEARNQVRQRLLARIARVNEIEMRDPNRFAPNPLGPGYLTRRERYNEVRWELRRRIANLAKSAS